MSEEPKYVMVTVISQFRTRYAIPMTDLQALNPDSPVDPKWALDEVTCQEVEEFSQHFLGETIIDHEVIDETRLLAMFDSEMDYLSNWPRDQKLAHIKNWKINKTEQDGTGSSN